LGKSNGFRGKATGRVPKRKKLPMRWREMTGIEKSGEEQSSSPKANTSAKDGRRQIEGEPSILGQKATFGDEKRIPSAHRGGDRKIKDEEKKEKKPAKQSETSSYCKKRQNAPGKKQGFRERVKTKMIKRDEPVFRGRN